MREGVSVVTENLFLLPEILKIGKCLLVFFLTSETSHLVFFCFILFCFIFIKVSLSEYTFFK